MSKKFTIALLALLLVGCTKLSQPEQSENLVIDDTVSENTALVEENVEEVIEAQKPELHDNDGTYKTKDTVVFDTVSDSIVLTIPDGYYDVTEEYLLSLANEYMLGETLQCDDTLVLANTPELKDCTEIIMANTMSTLADIVSYVQGSTVSTEDLIKEFGYYHYKGLEMPNLDVKDLKFEDWGSYEVNGVTYTILKESYTLDTEDKTPVEKVLIYSDTEDTLEIALGCLNVDKNKAVNLFKQLLKEI